MGTLHVPAAIAGRPIAAGTPLLHLPAGTTIYQGQMRNTCSR